MHYIKLYIILKLKLLKNKSNQDKYFKFEKIGKHDIESKNNDNNAIMLTSDGCCY